MLCPATSPKVFKKILWVPVVLFFLTHWNAGAVGSLSHCFPLSFSTASAADQPSLVFQQSWVCPAPSSQPGIHKECGDCVCSGWSLCCHAEPWGPGRSLTMLGDSVLCLEQGRMPFEACMWLSPGLLCATSTPRPLARRGARAPSPLHNAKFLIWRALWHTLPC